MPRRRQITVAGLAALVALGGCTATDAAVGAAIPVNWHDANGTKLRSEGLAAVRTVLQVLPGERTVVSGTYLVAGAPARMEVAPRPTWRPVAELEPTDAFGAVLFRDAAGTLLGGTASPLGKLTGARDTGKYPIDVPTDDIPDTAADANTEVVLSVDTS